MKKNAFTMIELIFVIVILGILATVALPYFGTTKRNADIVAGKADIASIRAAIISERQTQLVRGNSNYIDKLSDSSTTLFKGNGTRTLLLYGIKKGSATDGWTAADNTYLKYDYAVTGVQTRFDYNATSGMFGCTADTNDCNALVD